MCGIVGGFDPEGRVTADVLRRMSRELVHRGPDDEGYLVSGSVGLGMRRLSIIDLEGGHQPIANEDGRCHIVFNGEIYNYREQRAELRGKGHSFSTESDTEVILHRYEESGDECVRHLNGMFGFAIWDESSRRLLLARDRMGIKPLYYFWDGRTLLFASEVKAILASGLVQPELQPESLWHYLSFRYVPAPETMWRDIHKLPPGHRLVLDGSSGQMRVERWWDIRFSSEAEGGDVDQDVEVFTELFKDAVDRRLVADVPVGIFLSGGLDSSSVAAAALETHGDRIRTYAVGYADVDGRGELPWASQVARHLGTDHSEVVIGLRDFLDFLPELPGLTDDPLADPASIPLYYLSRRAAADVKVVLSGEGADEVLGGYTFDKEAVRWRKLARFQALPKWARWTLPAAVLVAAGRTRGVERLGLANIPLERRNLAYLPHMTDFFDSKEKEELWPGHPAAPDSRELIRSHYARAGSSDPLHQMLYVYCQDWLAEDLLMKADRMTMGASIELRVPFLDHRLVEWLASRPADRKVKRNPNGEYTSKYLLRRFAEPRLPAAILNRPKEGFPVPLRAWLAGGLGEFARDALLGADGRVQRWFRRDALERLVTAARTQDSPGLRQRLWLLLVLEMWARRWL